MNRRLSPPACNSIIPSRQFAKHGLHLAVLAASQLLAGASQAGPDGGRIVGGAGRIDRGDLDTVITQSSDRLAIDWDSFNVGANESVRFIQPDASSIALNRILGNNGSEIHGRIDANGHVVLVSPHGVFFGENATVNVGGLIASGLDISTDDFMNGSLNSAAKTGMAIAAWANSDSPVSGVWGFPGRRKNG
jgi:filamentous hemagglutinin family protein